LIDQAGLKGTWIGGARVSPLHANFMVTKEGANAADLLALIAFVRERVHAQFGVSLVLEVQPIGR
jgi:UDP-N-acetylmuramate dehydrogenase